MKAYVVQSFKNDFGEAERARLIVPEGEPIRKITVPGTGLSINPENNCCYECGTLTSLTLSQAPEDAWFSVSFVSGSEATVLTIPQTLHMPEDFLVEANTRYELNVRNGYGLAAGWAVSAS